MTQGQKDSDNPLLDFSGLPRFGDIRADQVEPALTGLLARFREQREQLFSEDRVADWDNFVQPLEDMDEQLHRSWSPVSHLNAVMNNEELRVAYNKCLPLLSEYGTELAQDPRVYRGYKQVADSEAFQSLSAAQQKIVSNALRDFRLAGAELDDAAKQQFKAIQMQLSALSSKFQENVLDATNAWELMIEDAGDLSGLPEFAQAAARKSAADNGKPGWRFTLDGPSYISFMTNADNRALRQQMYTAYMCRASDQGPHAGQWDNGPVMLELLRLKREQAQLLGFKNYAEVSLASKMANSVGEVIGFLDDLAKRSVNVARKEFRELQQFAKKELGIDDLQAWDVVYCAEKLRIARYDISQETLRPYFPEPQVLSGLFEIVHRLYGLRVEALQGVQTWHADVRAYNIYDASNELRGQFYFDLYARPHKRGGAWMDDCIPRRRLPSGDVQHPVAFMVCNFSAPVGDAPALLTHTEVITLFHEFGHGLHHMLTQVDYVGVSGINGVAWDAVELPSQFMENWCWEREALDLIAKHHETGEPLPDELYRKMTQAKNFQSAMHMVRQLEFALFDIRLHSEFDPTGQTTVQQLLDDVRAQVAVMTPPAFSRFQNGFTHIFGGGYAAGYYSYKWSEVLSADAFSKFEENGIFDRHTGEEFLHHILEKGGSEEPAKLFRQFRGREPRVDALLRHTGLA